jgi:MFS transporter, NNP family, nitrate/nitrite transporter
MQVSDIFRFKNREIKALHLTWIAFFICFYVWFNMAPLASSILKSANWLTKDDLRLFAIANVALTIPARILVGMALDRFGPRRVFSVLMVTMAVPTLFFAFGTSKEQLFVSRLVLSSVGASFVVAIHMTALWFKPRDIGFAEGFYAGWGNFGSAAAAMTLPTIALTMFGGPKAGATRWPLSGVIMGCMVFSTGLPSPTDPPKTPTRSPARWPRWRCRATAT